MGSTLTNLIYHPIFSTKNREPMIIPEIRVVLHRYLGGILKREGGILLQIGGMADHIHMVFKLKPVHTLSAMMQKVKGSSSKWKNEQKRLADKFAWQDGYGAFIVSKSQLEAVIHYVRDQEKHHKHRSFKDELIKMLEHHRVEYDEQYLWR